MTIDCTTLSSAPWGALKNVAQVTSRLDDADGAFFAALGACLARHGQTRRFAVTLLHSHFPVAEDELLLEVHRPESNRIETDVFKAGSPLLKGLDLVARSWKVENARLIPLTFVERGELLHMPTTSSDQALLGTLAALFVEHRVQDRFGLAHPGPTPLPGTVWVESENPAERRLVQELCPPEQLLPTEVLKTMWVFDEAGRFITVLGCCYRDKNGHQWRHANG